MKKFVYVFIAILLLGTVNSYAQTLDGYYKDINMLYYQGKTQKYLEKCNMAISGYPKEAGFYALRAVAFAKKKSYKKAYADLNKAIALDANNKEAFLLRGAIKAVELNSPQAGNYDVGRCSTIDDKYWGCFVARGALNYITTDDFERSQQDESKGYSLMGGSNEIGLEEPVTLTALDIIHNQFMKNIDAEILQLDYLMKQLRSF